MTVRSTTFDREGNLGASLLVAWTDPSGGYRVRTALVTEP